MNQNENPQCCGEMKRKLKIRWTCSDIAHHDHKLKWTAWLCGRWQKFIEKKITKKYSQIANIAKYQNEMLLLGISYKETIEYHRMELIIRFAELKIEILKFCLPLSALPKFYQRKSTDHESR